jgi:hypothetical protein
MSTAENKTQFSFVRKITQIISKIVKKVSKLEYFPNNEVIKKS